ncbi:unnamed protein product, partial [Mesorhabditis spiculigera]
MPPPSSVVKLLRTAPISLPCLPIDTRCRMPIDKKQFKHVFHKPRCDISMLVNVAPHTSYGCDHAALRLHHADVIKPYCATPHKLEASSASIGRKLLCVTCCPRYNIFFPGGKRYVISRSYATCFHRTTQATLERAIILDHATQVSKLRHNLHDGTFVVTHLKPRPRDATLLHGSQGIYAAIHRPPSCIIRHQVYIDRTRSRDRVKLSSQTFSSPGAIKSTLPDVFVYIKPVPCAARDSFTVPQADQVALRPSNSLRLGRDTES